jgi:4-cresol dehydrogenase (hydroxylating)
MFANTTSLPFLPDDRVDIADATYEVAFAEFTEVLGPDGVLTSPAALEEFRDPFQPVGWDRFKARGVLQPQTVEQVQEVVRIAGRHGIPLWTQSQGRNNGYGGAAPRVHGSITVNLRRMNQILEIDEELGYALVEPGVSFLALHEELRARGSKLMVSVPDIGWGSVVGNAIDSGLTYLPNGKDFAAVCGMEVVLADGDVLRTGFGAQPGNRAWNLYRRGFGPSLDGLFIQSNLGIVTKMGVWLQPQPETIMNVRVDAARDDDLAAMVDILRALRLDGTVGGVPCFFNTIFIANMTGARTQWWDGDPAQAIPDHVIDQIAATLGVGRWHLRISLLGDEPIVDHQFAKIEAAFEQIPDIRVTGVKTPGDQRDSIVDPSEKVMAGVPNLAWAEVEPWYGGSGLAGHMGFSPVVPMTGSEVAELARYQRAEMEAVGLDYAADLIAVNDRSIVCIAGMTFDYHDEAATQRSYEIVQRLVVGAAEMGYSEYRAHLHFMDLAADQLSFNDHAYRRFLEKIKDAVDPRGILSPGKQGIWPESSRPQRAQH